MGYWDNGTSGGTDSDGGLVEAKGCAREGRIVRYLWQRREQQAWCKVGKRRWGKAVELKTR